MASSVPKVLPTIEGMKTRALAIKNSLDEPNSMETATLEAELLYEDGFKLLQSQVNNSPLFSNIVSSVVVILNRLDLEIVQHDTIFLQTLSKTYSLFVELTTLQCHIYKMRTFNETVDSINAISDRMINAFSGKNASIAFEYSCAKEAAKGLKLADGFWSKYVGNIATNTENASLTGLVKTILTLPSDGSEGWYESVSSLRWLSSQITSVKKFNTLIDPFFQKFQEKGNHHTLCLAKVLMDLIQRTDTRDSVRFYASEKIVVLLKLQDEGLIKSLLEKKPGSKVLIESAKKVDCYWETRTLIWECTISLTKTHKQYAQPIINGFLERPKLNHLNPEIQMTLKRLEAERKSSNELVQSIEELLTPLRGEDVTIVSDDDQNQYTGLLKRMSEIESEIKNIKLIKSALEDLHKEETKNWTHLSQLFSKK